MSVKVTASDGNGGSVSDTFDITVIISVPSDWSLKPTGLAVGAKFRLLFLSSTKRDGSSSDIADYHAFIQTRAAAGHADIRTYSTGFRALGCTADTDARDTTYTTYTSTAKGVPIYWLNGTKAADQYEDFYDGTWDDEANDKNESGTNGPDTSQSANYPLTGCKNDGTEYLDLMNRSSALAKIEVMVGRPNSSAADSHGPLSSNTALDVSNTVTRPMYGLSAIFQVVPETTPPTLTSADVEETNGLTIYLEFSEDLQLSNPPLASAFTLTVDGSAVTGFSVALPGSLPQNAIWLRPPTAIRQGQAVVVTYTDPTAGNDTAAIQDTTGNDAADFTTGMNSVPAVINNSTVANAVLAGWSLTPTGLAVGDQFRLLFLSSTKRDATATDIATYNTFIQTRAAAGHTDIQAYSAGFRALGCTSDGRGTMRGGGVDARDNTETTYISTAKGVPIYWLDGAKAADQYEDFYDGSWDDEANDKNESGTDAHDTSQEANWPWTGCNHDGTEARQFAGAASRGLGTTVGSPNEVRYGRPDSSTVDHGPLSGLPLQNGPKAENRPLYGLSALFQVATTVVVNTPATGAPTITGTAQVGQTLTAGTTAIMDANGLTNVSYTYQWIRTATGTGVDTNISGATASTYTLVAADLGTTVKVRVSFTDDASNAETLTSAATAAVSAVVPSNWTLKPTAVAAGAKFRLLFLSSTRRNASSTDIATYNTFIQTRAANGHADIRDYSAGFRAVGCTAAVDARDNTATTYTTSDKGVPIYWLNGAKAADQYEDFYDGSWDDEANDKNESGTNGLDTSLNENWPLTGCDHDGTAHAALGASQVTRGRPNSSGSGHGPLNGNDQITSGLTSPLYGLSEVFQVAAAVVVPNNPPTVATAIPDQSATAGTAFSYVFPANTFSDADTGDTLSYTATKTDATALPTWLAFTAGTRTFAGTPQAADAGTVSVKVTASDGNGGSVSDTFDITVAADTTPPTLTSATVLGSGGAIEFQFSENVQRLSPPRASAFTATADGSAVTTSSPRGIAGVHDVIRITISPAILQGQAVVVTYTDPTASNDRNAIQDTAGNDAATFTTGMNGVPAVTNNSITNTPATGAPAITGMAQVGQTLTAGTTAIMDANGLTTPGYTYQWIRTAAGVDTNISGATASAYTLVAADQGTTIKVTVSFTDDASNPETLTSAATAAVSANNPPTSSNKNLALNEDTELTFFASDFTFTDADGNSLSSVKILSLPATDKGTLTFSGMALTSGDLPQTVPAAQFNSLKYVPPANENGGEIPFTSFTFRVNDGTDDSAATYTLSLFVYRVNDAATGQPGITGTAQVGQTLAATAGTIADVDGLPDPFLTDTNTSFQWVRVTSGTDADISGARDSTYTLVADDEGKKIKVKVSFLDTEATTNRTEGPLTSAATATVSASTNTPATGAPTITGTAQVGQTLTAVTTGIMDADGLTNVSYTYQWIRTAAGVDTNISGATASTYTLVAADLGTTVKVRVSFTDDASNAETLTSAATAAVTAAPNTLPSASNGTVTTNEDTAYTFIASEFNFSDADGDTLSNVRIVTLPASGKGTLALSDTPVTANQVVAATNIGTLAYTPPANANGTGYASFTFKVSDGTAESAADYTMTITVTAVNDAPTVATVIPDQSATAGTAFSYAFPANTFSDADTSDTLTYTATKTDDTALPTWLSFAASTRTFSGTPQAADTGTVSVKVTASDGNGGSVSDEFDIIVSAAANTPAVGTPTITTPNVFRVPAVLGVDLSGITDTNGTTGIADNATYKWQRFAADGTALDTDSIGTGSTYTLTDADAGKTLKVVVSFTDNGGNSEGPLTSAATAAITAAAICAAPTLTGGAVFLGSARKVVVGEFDLGSHAYWGFNKAEDAGSLDNAMFTTGDSNNYEILVAATRSREDWLLVLNAAFPANVQRTLAVHFCDEDIALGSVTPVPSSGNYYYTSDTLLQNWVSHTERTIYLSQDTAAPTFASATVNGTSLVITLSESLGAAASLANSAFTVKKNGSATRLTMSATAPLISGSTVTLTLAAASSVSATDTNVLVTYTKPGTGTANKLVDAFGNETATFEDEVVANVTPAATAPTAADGTVTTNEDTDHVFAAANFNYATGNTDPLASVKITGLPASGKGTLALDGTAIAATALPKTVTAVELTENKLKYSPPANANGTAYASFTFKVNDGTADSAEYTMTINVTAVNDPATGAPAISGTAQVGQTLTATVGTIADVDGLPNPFLTDGDTSFQWIRVATDNTETNIASATASTYTLVDADLGTTIKVKVSFTDDASNAETLTSAATAVVSAAANTPATGAPTITGTAQVEQTLTAVTTAIMDANGLTSVSYAYQWIRVDGTDADISGATSITYTLVGADLGTTIKVKVIFTDDASNPETLTSTATAAVAAAANTPATGAPAITGAAQVGQTLTAVTTAIMDADGLTSVNYMYQWIRVDGTDADISGATSITYTLVGADLGTTIKVKVIFTDDASNPETLTSTATAAVAAAANTPATGAPTITGTAQVGQTLTAGTTAIMDADGLTSVSYTYQWIRVDGTDADISGATSITYTLVGADLGTTIKVKVSFTDDASNPETLTSAATAAVAAAVAPTEVPAEWSLKPTGLTNGDKFRLLFLSSTKSGGSSTDIATYNTFVQGLAAAGHADIRTYSAGFRAVGCTSDVDARDNTRTTGTGVPIYWLNGAKAADNYADFYDGSWDDEVNDKNESGTNGPDTSQSVNRPFTGCEHNGTEALDGSISQGFGAAGGTKVGRPNSSSALHGPLSSNAVTGTANTRPMYGLSAVFQVAAAVVVPNNPPAFSADTADRSVPENTAAAQDVGAVLTATDADSDTLTYTLEGTDAASFDIVFGSGQIRTRTGVTYNHEAKSTHTVIVKADDGNGGTDTITVTITVTDVDEPPGIPAAPTVSATAGSNTSLDVSWTAPTNTGPAIASYDLQYREGASGNFTNGPQNVTGTSAAIGSLAADTSYEVQVRATNAEGDGDWSVAGTGRTTATSAPGAPTGLTATASGATQIDLSWSAPASTGGSAITGYKIEVSPNGTSGWTDQVANTNSTATTYAHTGLASGDTRHYRVSAINANGAGTASNVDSATTGTTVPGAPTGLTATASGATQINLSWTAPASDGGSAITGYKIEVSSNGGTSWTTLVADTGNATTTYQHTGLTASSTRHYRVSAINTNGSGTASNVDSATTGTTVPGAPTGLTATASGATQITLSWTAPGSTGGSAITGYNIEVSSNGGTSGWTDPRRQHQQHHHDLRAHRACLRRHPPLPRLRHQRQRQRHRLQRRQRHHRHHRARRPQRPHGHGQRCHPDQPLLERPRQHRRLRHHRLQDRGLLQWRLQLDRPGRQHRQHHHHLRAHRACPRQYPPLPRLRHQHQRQRHRLQRRQRHHGPDDGHVRHAERAHR